ncbi:hypothetical protein [Bradyrhizobium sp. UNPF46]|uniref:hypothetical protein n=1 Tax=Bradyrhizobium sp. UNPF46 TaxID=1141168 RepID=UPI0015F02DFF|nr:hypothetical protein [Bradyrhizobium sp. UNPF46]
MIRIAFGAFAVLLLGCSPGRAQVVTTGSTAMSLPTVPGAIVTSPLNSPGPFSSTTVPGAPDTTLAPVPLAMDPTTPGTVVVCAPPTTSPSPVPATPIVMSTGLSAPAGVPSVIPAQGQSGSSIGTIVAVAPLGTEVAAACSSTPGSAVASATSLPLSIPQVPAGPPPGTIPAAISDDVGTGIDPNAVAPSPNTSACTEGMTMNLGAAATVLPANASGAAPTPGVPPVLPSGC